MDSVETKEEPEPTTQTMDTDDKQDSPVDKANKSIGNGVYIIVFPDESRGYLGFSMVMPLPLPPLLQRFHFGHDNLKNILVRPFKFGMWVYMGNATKAIVL